ncbi:MAG: rRNA small subunit methyltransferase 1 [Nitrospira sp.]|nr:rRNA small subunit methyltransferase 1 [Nitrospira sp.]
MPTKRSQQNAEASRTSVGPTDRKGTLYVVAVSIGHPDDVTVRAIRTLGEVDIIASEDPNMTQQLLMHHGIQTTVTSYGPRNLREKAAVLLQRLQQGIDVAFVSDCGSPLVADPGHFLVAAAHAHGIPVVPVPGPSAIIAALTAAGFPCDSFYFLGYLPSAPPRITQYLIDSLKRKGPTVAFCTAPMVARILRTLDGISPRCPVAVAYDLTKPNERIIRGTACEVRERLRPAPGRDVTLVLAGRDGMESDDQGTGRAQSLSSRRIKIR